MNQIIPMRMREVFVYGGEFMLDIIVITANIRLCNDGRAALATPLLQTSALVEPPPTSGKHQFVFASSQ